VGWQLRDNVEWSLNIESKSFVELTLSWFSFPFIRIDNIPLLIKLSVLVPDDDVSVFCINTTLDV